MPYKFQPGRMYRMPTHFGPSLGPRQGVDGRTYPCVDTPKTISRSVSFLTNPTQLEAILPPGFALRGEPVVTVEAAYITEIEWLAGRGYNTLGIKFPVTFKGRQDRASGTFLAVLWENLTDPILTGREELGFSKIYCELPEPRIYQGETHCTASWMGFKFMDLNFTNMQPLALGGESKPATNPTDDGTLHYKYIPKTESWGIPEVSYAVLTPSANPNRVVQERWRGTGTVTFHKATWEELPTLVHIVNTLQELEIREYRGATIEKSSGGKDLSDQRILA
ncbi:MAG: hypothetical protein EXR62_11475 [Chloroflexi bacterium]|nr:hypothetical protein [Chloroflexota bacterium]